MSCERQLLLGVAGALSLFAGGAMAQPAPDPVAAALFREGRDLIKEGRWDEGCPKIEASLERFPAASPQLNLALCEEHGGRVATAWAMAQRAQTLNRETVGKKRRASLDAAARELIARLEPRLPYLTVRVVPAVDGARVQEEDGELPLDTPVPLDPGEHQLRLEAPGYATSERVVVLREGRR
ncbi:MAG: PEGA domain-containing protein [Polyangiaceae bacterium]